MPQHITAKSKLFFNQKLFFQNYSFNRDSDFLQIAIIRQESQPNRVWDGQRPRRIKYIRHTLVSISQNHQQYSQTIIIRVLIRMPRTICSDFSHFNLSISNSQDFVKAGMKRKKKRIDKRKVHPAHEPKKPAGKQRNIILNQKLCKKLVYSPEYTININEAGTPLYHSDEHQPSVETPGPSDHTPVRFHSYVTMEVLMKMVREAQEEKEEKQLVQEMKAIQISPMDEQFAMQ